MLKPGSVERNAMNDWYPGGGTRLKNFFHEESDALSATSQESSIRGLPKKVQCPSCK